MIKAKTFIEALNCFSTNNRRSKRFLTDKRLSQNERVILNCFFLLRDNLHQEIIAELSAITEITDPVVAALKDLLMGITYNNLDQHTKAISYIKESLIGLKNKGLGYFEMIAELNLFIIYQNLKDEKAMRSVLSHLKKIKINDPLSKIRILRCHFKFYVFINNLDEAESTLEEIVSLNEFMSDSDAIGLLVDQFNFAVTKNNLNEASLFLRKMKSHRSFASTEQYNFMKKLLDHEMINKPLYIDDQDFLNSPVLFYQIKVIQFLAEANLEDAEKMWKLLQFGNPSLYRINFRYTGPLCLFSLSLRRYNQLTSEELVLNETMSDPINFIQNHDGPIRKEILFQAFWGREPESKEDFTKLSKHLYDLKQKHNFVLKSHKGCYLLIKNKKKAA